jgi:hypothetical protein
MKKAEFFPQQNRFHNEHIFSPLRVRPSIPVSGFGGLVVSMLTSGTFGGLVVSMLTSGTFGGQSSFGGLVVNMLASGTFGGLVVSMLASGTQVRGFKRGLSRLIFRAKKSSACLPSEVK